MSKIIINDMTLRDGMHPQRHQTSIEQMIAISTALDDAGVPLIEVTHGDGLGGNSLYYGCAAATDEEYLSAVVPLMKNAKVTALLLPAAGGCELTHSLCGGADPGWQHCLDPACGSLSARQGYLLSHSLFSTGGAGTGASGSDASGCRSRWAKE